MTADPRPARNPWDEVFDPAFAGADSLLRFRSATHLLAAGAHTVLDVGCGRGSWVADGTYRPIEDLRGPDRHVIGLDLDPAAADNRTIDEFRLLSAPDAAWPLDTASVDLAVSDFTLEHVTDPDTFVDELARVLRPGGAFVARSVSRWSPLALAARAVPNRRHAGIVGRLQPARQAADVFPTAYLMNSRPQLARLLDGRFDWSLAHHGGLHHYLHPWPRLARATAAVEPRLPRAAQLTFVLCARRR